MDYAKPDPLKTTKTDIHKLINNLLEVLSNQFLQKKINVQKEFNTSTPIFLDIDERQIHQALMNIILNAIEHMNSGGTLSIDVSIVEHRGKGLGKPSNPQPLKSSTPSHVIITITDTGHGINKKDLPHIFDPFFTQTDHGTGLGLSITQSIIKQHKGKIFAESAVGQGTTFSIELPLAVEN